MAKQMKAAICRAYGKPEVLQIAQLDKPVPKKKEVLIKIHASSVTAEDPKMRSFKHPTYLKLPVGLLFGFRKPRIPVLGMEFAGTVEHTGPNVASYKAGDKVYGYTGLSFGAYAQYKCLPENALMHKKPENLSFHESACMVNGALSALVYLKKKGSIKKGDHILIYGASGSVGSASIQLAKYFGAYVTGVCSTKNLDLVQSIGADRVIDYTKEKLGGSTYDLIFDTVGKTNRKECLSLLKSKGKYLLTDFAPRDILASLHYAMFSTKSIVIASSNFHWKKQDLGFLKHLAEKEHLRPVIDQIFPLDEIAAAHAYVELGHKVGNVAISVD